MANRLNNYEPIYFARMALMWLKNRRGMYQRVYRVFEDERRAFGAGMTVNIRKPATFVAQDAPGSTAQDIKTGTAQVNIDIFKEVKILATDLEEVASGRRLITEHVGPMIDAIGDEFDKRLYALAGDVPHTFDFDDDTDVGKKFAAMRRIMVENKVPYGSPIAYMASPLTMERAGGSMEFSQAQGAGDAAASNVQATGLVARKYGFDFFESQNGPVLGGDAQVATPATPVVTGTPLKNAKVVTLDSADGAGDLRAGQVIAITYDGTTITEKYTVTATTTAVGNAWTNLPISPGLRRDVPANSTWAIVQTSGVDNAYTADLAFHRNAFAAVMVSLPDYDGEGVKMAVASDPQTGLSVRARFFYDGHEAERYCVIDALGGIATLDADLALRPLAR